MNPIKPYSMHRKVKFTLVAALCLLFAANIASALTVTQTSTSSDLSTALGGGGGLTINSATVVNGTAQQFGTYTGFTSAPVTIGNGVVLSSGIATQTTAAFHNSGNSPSTDTGAAGTAEFDAYGPGHITNFASSHNVAALQVSFTLASASQVGFNFIFGSIEYPVFTNDFTDSFLAFLDGTGTANQIVFDSSNNAVQVGSTFASLVRTDDTNSAFSDPHGLLALQTFTQGVLSAGTHTLTFEVGDVNDGVLDSAAFISELHAGTGTGGTTPPGVPDSGSTLSLLGLAMVCLAALRYKPWMLSNRV
jgi:VPDSG-CTERM motif